MGHRSVGRALETSNIVPGMSGDHPASIPEAGGRPGAPQRPPERIIILFPKIDRWSALRAPTSESDPRAAHLYAWRPVEAPYAGSSSSLTAQISTDTLYTAQYLVMYIY